MPIDRVQARRRLDQRFDRLRALAKEPRPHRGWVRAIREAMGMATGELASRMGVIQQAIPELERNELHGSIQLDTMRRAADALDCDFVYALIPRSTLDEAVTAQARRKAALQLAPVAHHNRLEDQAVTPEEMETLVEETARTLVDRRGLWTEPKTARG